MAPLIAPSVNGVLPGSRASGKNVSGFEGWVDGRLVAVGSRSFARKRGLPEEEIIASASTTTRGSGEAHVIVAIDGHVGGIIVMADELRPDADTIVERLRAEGVRQVALISGDRRTVAERIGRELGVDRVYAEQSAEQKLEVVRRVAADPTLRPVIMVGTESTTPRLWQSPT